MARLSKHKRGALETQVGSARTKYPTPSAERVRARELLDEGGRV